MKAAFVKESSVVSVNEIDNKKPGPGELLIKMQACGICGSDVEKVFGKYGQPSMRLGHEPAGIVAEVGDGVDNFKIGDRVFTHHHVPCYSCHLCNHGNETMCEKYYETNLDPCGLSENYIVPQWNVSHGGVLKLPDSMSFEEASLIEPLACCIRSWNKVSFKEGDSVAILGIGATGMMHALLAQEKNAKEIFCLDVNDFRLDFAKSFGLANIINSKDQTKSQQILAKTDNRGVDLAIVATGSLQAFSDAIDLVRKGGTIVMFGVPSKGDTIPIDMSKIYSKEITITSSYAASDLDTKEALELIDSSKVDFKKLITHSYSLDKSHDAFLHAHNGSDSMKIIITN